MQECSGFGKKESANWPGKWQNGVRDTCGVRIDAGQDDGVILAIARRHQAASHLIALNEVLLLLAEMRFGDGRLTLQL